ncbi:hypothetical protein DPMN_158795 [Dreissena polymorpha]|uniref:Uncharacterized protein n=1 Tax=Dreissena polymorpha TaxID=45954 RepID=A0A9D4EJL7_DREPO|nr:hypothetical protein DPMN_158795 [Dreissena polymorpha]
MSLKIWRRFDDLRINQQLSFLKFFSAPKQLETLRLKVFDNTNMWESLHDLTIKSLSLSVSMSDVDKNLQLNNISSLSWALSTLTQLETLNLKVRYLNVGNLEAIRGLNIKSLSLRYLKVQKKNAIAPLSRLLLSLTHLESLSIKTFQGKSFAKLSDALHDLNIKNLSLSKA